MTKKREDKFMAMLVVILSLLVLVLLIFMYFSGEFHIFVLNQQRDETIEISKTQIQDCCEYYEFGEKKMCRVIVPHDCSICEQYCSR